MFESASVMRDSPLIADWCVVCGFFALSFFFQLVNDFFHTKTAKTCFAVSVGKLGTAVFMLVAKCYDSVVHDITSRSPFLVVVPFEPLR